MNWTTESHCRNVSNRRIKPNIEIAYSWTVLNRSKATTTCRRKTGKYIGGNLLYYPNSVKTTRLFTLQLCGDVELNPGPVTKHPCKDISPVEQFMENNRLNNSSYILHLNSRSLLSVIDQLRILFDESKPLIIAISETWLNSTVADLEVDINGYKIERLDRTSRGGGVAIYFRDGCKFKRRADLEDPNIEAICVELKIGKVCYILACVYRAPKTSFFFHTVESMKIALNLLFRLLIKSPGA